MQRISTTKQWLVRRITKFFENIESTITKLIVVALLGGSSLLVSSNKALNLFLQILNIPTPLWATIILVLLVILYRKKISSLFLLKSKRLVEKNYKETKTNKDAIVCVKIGEKASGI